MLAPKERSLTMITFQRTTAEPAVWPDGGWTQVPGEVLP